VGPARPAAMSHPVPAMTLREVLQQRTPGDRKRTSVLRAGALDSLARCTSPASPSAGALPPLPAFMSCPELLADPSCAAPSARTATGEESDVNSAVSMLSGRSTVMPSTASTPTGSSAPSPRHWWAHETPRRYESEDADSWRDDDSVSTVSSISAISTCSERSTATGAEKPRKVRPHTATVRSSTGSIASLDRAQSGLACLSLGRSLSGRHVQTGERMPAEFEAIFSKARHGRYKEVNELLEAGAPIDGVDARGNTPLHAACQGGSLKTVKTLLRRGCETNAQNHQGNTPLHYAFSYKYEEVAEYLVRKGGAVIEIRNLFGLTAVEGLGNKLALERSSMDQDTWHHSSGEGQQSEGYKDL
jgi:hypothetical protein